jgi:hypothetical protein
MKTLKKEEMLKKDQARRCHSREPLPMLIALFSSPTFAPNEMF